MIAIIFLDKLYFNVFHEGTEYHSIFDKKSIFFIILWGLTHIMAIIHDSTGDKRFLFSFVGIFGLGVGIILYLYLNFYTRLKQLLEYIKREITYQQEDLRWKVKLVHKQCFYILRSILIVMLALLFTILGLNFILFDIESAFGIIFTSTGMLLLFISFLFQFIGFFYPSSLWKKFMES
jgi:uncharacterized phage infection (PIP) family protein YhgE